MKKSFVLIVLLAQFLLVSCLPQSITEYEPDWRYEDIRLIDPSDASLACADILAVYLRQRVTTHGLDGFQARLDMLDVDFQPEFDLYLAIDDQATTGTQRLPLDDQANLNWDRLARIDANGGITVVDNNFKPLHNISIRIIRDSLLDTLTIDYHEAMIERLPAYFNLQLFTTEKGSSHILDRTGAVNLAIIPPKPVNVLFAFWDTYPAYTPIQALRRWDGAHTGPLGGRHGLANLLRTFDSHHVPLTLLDLTTPASLAALDYGGDLALVQSMVDDGLLILPAAAPLSPIAKPLILPPWYLKTWLQRSDIISSAFALSPSPYLFWYPGQPLNEALPNRYQILFVPSPGISQPTTLQTFGHLNVVPVDTTQTGAQDTLQPQTSGPSMAMRKILANTAIDPTYPDKMIIFGGDLPDSTWGDPQIARTSLQYLKNRPWIRFLDKNQMATFPVEEQREPRQDDEFIYAGLEDITQLRQDQESLLEDVKNLPDSSIKEAAWQLIASLLSPANLQSPELNELRSNYWIALDDLVDASQWTTHPEFETTCESQVSDNELSKCILASPSWYLSFDPQNACIRYGFIHLQDGVHQIFAPEYQLMSGQSDPSFWDLSLGLRADPTLFACAFDDPDHHYQWETGKDQLIFQDKTSGMLKSFRISGESLLVQIDTDQPVEIAIPLALDPWSIYSPAWAEHYQSLISDKTWIWRLNPIIAVETNFSTSFEVITFKDDQKRMRTLEDPNVEKLPGDYLPFPIAQTDMMVYPSTTIKLSVFAETNGNGSQ